MILILLLCGLEVHSRTQMVESLLQQAEAQGYPAAIEAAEAYGLTPYAFGMMLAEQAHRPRAAARWFKGLDEEMGRNDEWLFGLAWSHWLAKETTAAQKVITSLMASDEVETRAKTHYLAGLIQRQSHHPAQASTHFEAALQLFAAIEQEGRAQVCALALARQRIEAHDFESAQTLLDEAQQRLTRLSGPIHRHMSAGQILELRHISAYRRGCLEEACSWAQAAALAFDETGMTNDAARCRARLALCLGRVGKLEQAEKLARELDREKGDQEQVNHYTMLVWMVLGQNRGLDDTIFARSIQRWAEQNEDTELKELLASIGGHQCQLE